MVVASQRARTAAHDPWPTKKCRGVHAEPQAQAQTQQAMLGRARVPASYSGNGALENLVGPVLSTWSAIYEGQLA